MNPAKALHWIVSGQSLSHRQLIALRIIVYTFSFIRKLQVIMSGQSLPLQGAGYPTAKLRTAMGKLLYKLSLS